MELSEDSGRVGGRVESLERAADLFRVFLGEERGVLFLDVGAVHQHHATEIGGGVGAVNLAVITAAAEDGNDPV